MRCGAESSVSASDARESCCRAARRSSWGGGRGLAPPGLRRRWGEGEPGHGRRCAVEGAREGGAARSRRGGGQLGERGQVVGGSGRGRRRPSRRPARRPAAVPAIPALPPLPPLLPGGVGGVGGVVVVVREGRRQQAGVPVGALLEQRVQLLVADRAAAVGVKRVVHDLDGGARRHLGQAELHQRPNELGEGDRLRAVVVAQLKVLYEGLTHQVQPRADLLGLRVEDVPIPCEDHAVPQQRRVRLAHLRPLRDLTSVAGRCQRTQFPIGGVWHA